jgi:hypothetical protein
VRDEVVSWRFRLAFACLAVRTRATACGSLASVETHLRSAVLCLERFGGSVVGRVRCDFPPTSGPGASPASAGALLGAVAGCAVWGRASGA